MTTFALNLGSSQAGHTDMRAALKNSLGITQSTVSTGFTDLTLGQYAWNYTLPAGTALVTFSNVAASFTPITLSVDGPVLINSTVSDDSITAYLYTKDGAGAPMAGVVVYYQRVGQDHTAGGWTDAVQTVTSDSNGLVQVTLDVGSYYRYWIKSGRYRTVHITADTTDPYELPAVQG